MARKKMWWQDQNDFVKPFVVNPHRDPCDCSQGLPLRITGYSEKQGPEYYCPVCRWAFWVVLQKPTADQVKFEKRFNPDASEKTMSYYRLCNKPGVKWGSTPETVMIDQLGRMLPTFLTVQLKRYWNRKYCEKYPSTERGKAYAERKKKEAKNRS